MCGVRQSVIAHMQIHLPPFKCQLFHLFKNKFHPWTCTVNWFNEHLYSKLVLCIMSIPCTFFSLVMSVPVHSQCKHVLKSGHMCNVCPLYIPLTSNVHWCDIPVPMFTVQVRTKPVYSTGAHKTSLQYRCTENTLQYKCI